MAGVARRLLATVALTLAVQVPAAAQTETLALVATYADGRVTESPVGPDGRRAWTPLFPRVPEFRDPDGVLPVQALNTRVSRIADGVRVEVSVLRGRPSAEIEEAIGTFDVFPHQPATVEGLRRVGVLPVTYAVKPFAAPALHVPQASSRVEGLEVEGVEPMLDPVPAYRITVRNRTDSPVVSFAVNAYRAGADVLSGQQGEPDARPVISPGASYTFTLKLSGGRPAGQSFATVEPLGHIAVTAALWADGRIGGDAKRAATLAALHRGRLRALEAVLPWLRDAATAAPGEAVTTLRRVRDALAALPSAMDAAVVARTIVEVPALTRLGPADAGAIVATGANDAQRRLIADIDRVLASATPALAHTWLREAREACEAWHARLTAMFASTP